MAKMNIKFFIKRDYGEKSWFWLEKNKANSKPIAGLRPGIWWGGWLQRLVELI